MNAFLCSILALVVTLWVAAVAAEPRPVGTTTLDLVNPATGRKVTTQVWYEAAPGATPQPFKFHPAMRPIHVALNSSPAAAGKRPLIVMLPSHPGTTADDQTVARRFRPWDRSGDVTFTLDRVLSDPAWAALVDQSRIGFFGHSFGGFTGVSLAGGRYEPARQRAFWAKAATKDLFCSAVSTEDE